MRGKIALLAGSIGLAASIGGVLVKLAKMNRPLICSPMMDDGLAAPIMDYAQKHPDVAITRKFSKQLLQEHANGG